MEVGSSTSERKLFQVNSTETRSTDWKSCKGHVIGYNQPINFHASSLNETHHVVQNRTRYPSSDFIDERRTRKERSVSMGQGGGPDNPSAMDTILR